MQSIEKYKNFNPFYTSFFLKPGSLLVFEIEENEKYPLNWVTFFSMTVQSILKNTNINTFKKISFRKFQGFCYFLSTKFNKSASAREIKKRKILNHKYINSTFERYKLFFKNSSVNPSKKISFQKSVLQILFFPNILKFYICYF